MVEPLAKEMGSAYPELLDLKTKVEETIKQEEIRFAVTLDQGMEILENSIKTMENNILPGHIVFKLYETTSDKR